MSQKNGARRNHVGRKLRSSKHIPLEIKGAIQVVIDFLNSKSGYLVAWPSANTIASRMGRSRRSGLHYVKVIKALGIFHWKSLSPEEATKYCERTFGVRPKLERCGGQAPNIFIVNEAHPFWNSQKKLPEDVDREMGKIARRIKVARNARTTSSLASDPARRPKGQRYNLVAIRMKLSRTLDRLRDEVATDAAGGEIRWCRDNQVFRLSSVEANVLVAPPSEIQKAVAIPSLTRSPKRHAVTQPCSRQAAS
jgi:hypothetical protein